ncbi:Retrovirus-related Pol polyprotein from transposon 17.6 [Labeo rohita]|uniref:Retrovirus-related Pol polyprotein from transposon 17.6 n=1 Tax=Labeo rohita TaxID=84645 RepID=A0ABQ8LB21_LABRO|nr:Retrovirus-related Pol polyprotein from transposon 17.6 [Labeo rohita]
MVLVPTSACKFLATWQGPYTVIERVGPVMYRLRQPGRRREEQLYHINLLKKWVGTREQLTALASTDPVLVDMGDQLSAAQKTELNHLVIIVRQRPYRVPEAQRQAIENEIKEMLKLGVIEPSRSAWSSPIVMVPKPDGTLRFCNDFCWLNEVSEFDGYPMPCVDELLKRLGRARFITTLDLTKGYWQVPLTTSAKEKNAFSTPSGHWQYPPLRPPRGPRHISKNDGYHFTSPSGLCRRDHLEWLRRVLLELRWAGLTANPRKCHLALAEAQYLGFRVGRGLIQPQQKKNRRHPNSAPSNNQNTASPLTDLTRKGQPEKIVWSDALDKTFQDIKTALTTEPVWDGEEHPVIYISRKLTPAETRYAAVEKEALAIKWAVLELRYYLLGRRFTLMTDHAPLHWMARAKDINARVTRWFLALQDFNFTVEHRAGTANSNADGLSRLWSAYTGSARRLGGCEKSPELSSASPWK